MVESYGVAKEPQDVGYYTGVMMAVSMCGQFFMSVPWGFVSDRTGRKPWLCMSIVVTAVLCIILGFTRNYYAACITLFCHGFLHCTVLLTKSIMAELCDETIQAKGFSILVFAWGVGAIIGPTGSTLAQPCKNLTFPGACSAFLSAFPFSLTFMAAASYHVATAISLSWLPETNPNIASSSLEEDLLPNRIHGSDESESQRLTLDSVLVTVVYGCLNFMQVYVDTLFSVFAAAPQTVGGLGFSSLAMGIINVGFGILVLSNMSIIFPRVGRQMGPLNCVKIGFALYVPLWLMVPFSACFNGQPVIQMGTVVVIKAVRAVAGSTAFAGMIIVVSNSASSCNLGLVTGLGETIAGVLMAVGPILAGYLWAALATSSVIVHQFVPWIVPSVLSGCMLLLTCYLPKSLNRKKAAVMVV